MTTSLQKLIDKNFDVFLKSSKKEQQDFMKSINIYEIKGLNKPLFKKFIAMKVFMEARRAAENKSCLNLTAQFRNFIALLAPAVALGADYGDDSEGGPGKTGRGVKNSYRSSSWKASVVMDCGENIKDASSNGYRLFHISEIGHFTWSRKFFNLGFDEENNIYTKRIKTSKKIFPASKEAFISTKHDEIKKWDQLDDSIQLGHLLAEIKNETTYENTLGYDFLCFAAYCMNHLLDLSFATNFLFGIILVPLALIITGAIYAAVIPVALTMYTIEKLLVEPIKWIMSSLSKDEHETFYSTIYPIHALKV